MWIRTVDPNDAEGLLKQVYERQVHALGEVTEFTRLGSLYPELAAVRLDLYRVADHCPSNIPEWARQLIALLTSVLNKTPHCASGLGGKVREAGGSPELVERVYADPVEVRTGDERVDALLTYVRKVVHAPWEVTESDIQALHDRGWGDLDILDANNMCAYYCYINRVANGLGLKTLTIPAPDIA